MSDVIKAKVIDLVEDALKNEGYELADLTLASHGNRATLRLYLYGEKNYSKTSQSCLVLSKMLKNNLYLV